jgi:hypothetical protein
MRFRLIAVMAVLLGGTGCLFIGRPPGVVVLKNGMQYEDAIGRSEAYCRERGYSCRVDRADFDDNKWWKVTMDVNGVRGAPADGRIKFKYDAYARTLVNVDEKIKHHKIPPGHAYGHDKDKHDDKHDNKDKKKERDDD